MSAMTFKVTTPRERQRLQQKKRGSGRNNAQGATLAGRL
jgi:hypothetical protein